MQREIFLKLVSKLEDHCEIVLIGSDIDYRRFIAQHSKDQVRCCAVIPTLGFLAFSCMLFHHLFLLTSAAFQICFNLASLFIKVFSTTTFFNFSNSQAHAKYYFEDHIIFKSSFVQ